jgi:hypothetical protein
MATTPESVAYLIPTAGSISVGSNLIADSSENRSTTISANNYSVIQTQPVAAIAGTVEVNTNLIADSRENQSTTISTNNYSLVQGLQATVVIGTGIEIGNTAISSTPTSTEQISLSKIQIWSIS